MNFFHTLNHAASKTQCKLGISKWKSRITDTFFGKTITGKDWIRENEHLKKIEFFLIRENWYPQNTILWLMKLNTCEK